jgi:SAM-dependent methyltransferase
MQKRGRLWDRTFSIVRCVECGLVYVNPRIAADQIAALYDEAYDRGDAFDRSHDHTHDDDENPTHVATIARVVATLYAALGGLRGARVLDVGCGTGTLLARLRFTTDFSVAYLSREIDAAGSGPPATVFFGDSVLWGYRLPADEIAVSLLDSRGCTYPNFSFKSGSPSNDYAIARLFVARKIHPRTIVIESIRSCSTRRTPSTRPCIRRSPTCPGRCSRRRSARC